VALPEKGLDFQLIPLKLNGDQLTPEFLSLNPFHHIPVLVDGDFSLFESLAILDYLEAQYPDPSLLPLLPNFGLPLTAYPQIQNWITHLQQRPSWRQTEPKPEEIAAFKARMQKLMAK
jgi:glutathione S-transferase